jgi:exodeoxyribonuclease X
MSAGEMYPPVIRVVDLETTGFEPAPALGGHMPVELGWCDVHGGRDLLGAPSFADGVTIGAPQARLVRPGRPIPPETSAVHHLVDDDIAGAEPWRQEMIRCFGGVTPKVAFAAHSAQMERKWCTPELVGPEPWICTYKCALRAWPEAPGHGNQVLRYWLAQQGLTDGLDRALAAPAHRAGPDAYVTAFLLRALLAAHPVETLLAWSEEPAVLIRVPFGKRPEEGGNRGLYAAANTLRQASGLASLALPMEH